MLWSRFSGEESNRSLNVWGVFIIRFQSNVSKYFNKPINSTGSRCHNKPSFASASLSDLNSGSGVISSQAFCSTSWKFCWADRPCPRASLSSLYSSWTAFTSAASAGFSRLHIILRQQRIMLGRCGRMPLHYGVESMLIDDALHTMQIPTLTQPTPFFDHHFFLCIIHLVPITHFSSNLPNLFFLWHHCPRGQLSCASVHTCFSLDLFNDGANSWAVRRLFPKKDTCMHLPYWALCLLSWLDPSAACLWRL